MTMPKSGPRDTRPIAKRADRSALPYKIYMQITCLEMERARRNQERRNASQRIAVIDARLREVEAEKAALLQSVGERITVPVPAPAAESELSPRSAKKGFKIRY